MKTAAIYRAYYGSDWIRESIESVYGLVDEVWVFLTHRPFGDRQTVRYKGAELWFPYDVDGVGTVARSIAGFDDLADKMRVQVNPYGTQLGDGIGRIIRELVMPRTRCDHVLLVETDQIWPEGNLRALLSHAEAHPEELEWSAEQDLFWRSPRFAFRRPPDTFLRSLSLRGGIEATGFGLSTGHPATLPPGVLVQNFGYASSPRTMFWKHMAALSFSRDLGIDSPPREEWFEEVWMPWSWSKNRRTDICPSAGAPDAFSPPLEFNMNLLVPAIRDMILDGKSRPEWLSAE